MSIKKYFWDFNEQSINETKNKILKNPDHPKYISRMFILLTRCDKPKELFSFIEKEQFIDTWPLLNKYWNKTGSNMESHAWWKTIYEQLSKQIPADRPIKVLINIGRQIKTARMENRMNQVQLAERSGIDQSEISKIEHGKMNISVERIYKLMRILKIDQISIKS